jgi:regulatory factor X 4
VSRSAIQRSIKSRNAKLTLKWLEENYEEADGVCLPRSVLYTHYLDFFKRQNLSPVSAASFGKVIRQKFPNLTTRRLGTRGQSKYHYYGIGIKKTSQYFNSVYSKKGLTRFSKGISKPEGNSVYTPSSKSGTLLPAFPNVKKLEFPENVSTDKVETFLMMYRTHCQRILDTVVRANFGEIQDFLLHFWQAMPPHMVSVLGCDVVVELIAVCDITLYNTLTEVLIPATLQALPETLSHEISQITKQLGTWLTSSTSGLPDKLRERKLEVAEAFCKSLKRQTSLIHLAQAAKGVLRSSDMVTHMLADWRGMDFSLIRSQMLMCMADDAGKSPLAFIDAVISEFEQLFVKQVPLEIYFEWLDSLVQSEVLEASKVSGHNLTEESRCFALKWSYFGELTARELTLHSAPSFGSFHLLYLVLLEYINHLLESLGEQDIQNSAKEALNKYMTTPTVDDVSSESVLVSTDVQETATDPNTITAPLFQADSQQSSVCTPVDSFTDLAETLQPYLANNPMPASNPMPLSNQVAYQPPYASPYDPYSGYNSGRMFGAEGSVYDMGVSAQSLPSFQYPLTSMPSSQAHAESFYPSSFDLSQFLSGPQTSNRMDYSTVPQFPHSTIYPSTQTTDRQHEVNVYSVYG